MTPRALLGSVAALLALIPATAGAQKYRYPISDTHVSATYVTAHFDHSGKDYNCGSKRYSGHKGNDYGCGSWSGMSAGRDIVAAAAGTVDYTHDGEFDQCSSGSCAGGGGFGNYVKMTHSDGKTTYYAHMKKGSVAVKAGQSVKCGDKLGQVGSSGYSTGPHLHFEVRSSSSSRDPYTGSCGGYGYWVSQGGYLSKPGTTCDGSSGPVCGNGKCESGETSASCPKDCGTQLDAKYAGQGSNALQGSGGAYYSLCPGQAFKFWFKLTNTGTLDWEDKGKSGTAGQAIKLGLKSGEGFGAPSKVSLNQASDTLVKPGETTQFTMDGTAPTKTGVYKTEWQLLSDGVGWVGPAMYLTFNVTTTPPEAGAACTTGKKGVCSAGTKQCSSGQIACVETTKPSSEKCDGLDNDCDGQVDEACTSGKLEAGAEGTSPGGDGPAPLGDLPAPLDAGPGPNNSMDGGCGCGVGGRRDGAAWVWAMVAAVCLLVVSRRRRHG